MATSTAKPHVRSWLETSEAEKILDKAAKSVMEAVHTRSLPLTFLLKDAFGVYAPEDLFEDIRSKLVLFLLEKEKTIQGLLAAGGNLTPAFLKHAFINHWISHVRKSESDPERHLYKRTTDVLRGSDDFHTLHRGRKYTVYSMAKESIRIPPLTMEDFSEIPFPHEWDLRLEYDAINRKKTLLRLAAYFWKKVAALWGESPVWIDVRDFIAWISLTVDLKTPKPLDRKTEEDDLLFGTQGQERSTSPETAFDPEMVKNWAKNFCNDLNEKERKAFYFRHGLNLKLKDIASKLGYSGSSGAKYLVDAVEDRFRYFLRDLPWVSPDDLNKEALSLFLQALNDSLKKSVPEP